MPHLDYIVDGARLVSVTEALSSTGLKDLSRCSPVDLAYRSAIGTAVHEATALLDNLDYTWDMLDPDLRATWDEVDPRVAGGVHAWEEFKRRENFVPRLVEHRIITPGLVARFGTTLDREGLLRGKPAIVEIKVTQATDPWWGIQLAGQHLAMRAKYGLPKEPPYRWTRWAAWLRPDKTPPYQLVPFADEGDDYIFTCALALTIWKLNQRRAR